MCYIYIYIYKRERERESALEPYISTLILQFSSVCIMYELACFRWVGVFSRVDAEARVFGDGGVMALQ